MVFSVHVIVNVNLLHLQCFLLNEQLRGYLNEILLDQIPNLIDLQRYLEHLAVVEPPMAKKDLVLEQVSVIFEK